MANQRDHYHHGNLREALVGAAQCLITESGVGGLSLRKVAKHAGVSQAAPYHHFSNKEALLAEVSMRGFEMLTAQMVATEQAFPDVVERVEQLGRVYVAFGNEHKEVYGLMMGAEYCVGEAFPAVQEAAQQSLETLVRAITQGQAEGVFRGQEPIGIALAVWSAMHGLVSLVHTKFRTPKDLGDFTIDAATVVESTLAFLLAGLGSSTPSEESVSVG